jgi:hypothetical protein
MGRLVSKGTVVWALLPALLTLLANLPGRYALSIREHQFGHGFATTLAVSVLEDIAWQGPIFAVALSVVGWLPRRSTSAPRVWRGLMAVAPVAFVAVVALLMWLVSVAATEFRIQRGTYPSLAEALEGLRDPAFRRAVGILWFERYATATLSSALAGGVLVALHLHARARDRDVRRAPGAWRMLAGRVAVSMIALGVVASISASSEEARLQDLAPPLVRLLSDLRSPSRPQRFRDVREVLEGTRFDAPSVRRGLKLYGFGDQQADELLRPQPRADCEKHPLARPLPGDTGGAWPGGAGGEDATPLVRAAVDLSAALFDGHDGPLVVWHVALESFRGDDVHAVHPAAPAELTPFIGAASATNGTGGAGAVAFAHAYQAGVRTAQAVSGLICGIGPLPFQLAVSRDLFDVPLRCAPDVLSDAGFSARVFYGSDASFEHLDEFSRAHRLTVTDVSLLPKDLPRGAWRAVTDTALLSSALALARGGAPLQYNFVLSLSGHAPYDVPQDAPGSLGSVVEQAVRMARAKITAEDRRRLLTIAYADDALGRFVRAVEGSPEASHTLFVVSADHATSEPFVWDEPSARSQASVPLLFYLPGAFIGASANPGAVRAAIGRLSAESARAAVSLSDVPALLLALLSRHAALRRLPAGLRWHTLGGVASSSAFALPVPDAGSVWGIDAAAEVFVGTKLGQIRRTGETSVAFSVWEKPLGPVLHDATAALSALLGGYARQCAPRPAPAR